MISPERAKIGAKLPTRNGYSPVSSAYRDGVQTPRVTQKEGWNVDGIEFKVRLDAAPAIADHVGLAKNPGPA